MQSTSLSGARCKNLGAPEARSEGPPDGKVGGVRDPIELAAIDRGAGPAIALVHGGIVHSGPAWAGSIGPLVEAGYRVVAVDRRGHGRSEAGDAAHIPVHLHADDLRLTLELRDVKEAHVVGVSYGANVCLEFAMAWPERALSLTLCEPSTISLLTSDPDYREWVQRFVEIEGRAGRGSALQDWFFEWLGLIEGRLADKTSPDSPTWRLIERNAPLIFKEEPGWRYEPGEDRLRALECPTLILNGALSEPPMQAIGEMLSSMIPKSKRVWIEGGGHDVHARKPDEFNDLLTRFLRENDPR